MILFLSHLNPIASRTLNFASIDDINLFFDGVKQSYTVTWAFDFTHKLGSATLEPGVKTIAVMIIMLGITNGK